MNSRLSIDSDHLLPQQRCPACGHLTNRAGGGAERPSEGDVMVCISCATALELGPGNLMIRLNTGKLSTEELAEVWAMQQAVKLAKKAVHAKRNKRTG